MRREKNLFRRKTHFLLQSIYLECLGPEYHLTTYYLAILRRLLVIACCISGLLANQSAMGRIFEPTSSTNPHVRRLIELLLYINIILTFVELIWTAIGTYFTINDFIKYVLSRFNAVLVEIGPSLHPSWSLWLSQLDLMPRWCPGSRWSYWLEMGRGG